MIQRALYAYPVGSIFKLVTAACAFDQGVGYNFTWDCDGAISVGTQRFRCHELQGHGVQHMADAMRSSCNPYFIALGQALSGSDLLQTAKSLGFGTEIMLTSNMIASGGTLPTLQQLKLPAEQANFSFAGRSDRIAPADRQNDLCHRRRRHAPGSAAGAWRHG